MNTIYILSNSDYTDDLHDKFATDWDSLRALAIRHHRVMLCYANPDDDLTVDVDMAAMTVTVTDDGDEFIYHIFKFDRVDKQ